MSLVRVNFLVEGQTEETFVNRLLAPYFGQRNIEARARCVTTSRDRRRGRVHRGGVVSYEKIKYDLVGWLQEDREAYFTTMLDLYGLPDDFPGYECVSTGTDCYERVQLLEEKFRDDIGSPRFVPHLQLHEFEALLFSDPSILDQAMVETGRSSCREAVVEALNDCGSPERINDSADTAPSKRLDRFYPGYQEAKTTLGVQIAMEIGLDTIRSECPHFNEWVCDIEDLDPR